MATNSKTFLTPEQYLEIERAAEFRSEYHDGEMFAMAGAREAHNLIVLNLAGELRAQRRKKHCRACVNEMRVLIATSGLYTYPDGVVVCEEPQFLDDVRDTLLNPGVIVEVLSPSTEAYDRGRKFENYRKLPSLRHYLLLSSERIGAELFTRQDDGGWLLTEHSATEDAVELRAADMSLKLRDLYEEVEFSGAR